ncbi:hypothetical protein [Alienimonas chondri]|nr:hypothetical protein [Alienimonas chondri]
MPTRLNRTRVGDVLRRHVAWRHGRRAALAAATAAALGVGGCATLKTPSAAGGKNAALRSLSPNELREVAAMFEAQGHADRAEHLFAAADHRSGVSPIRRDAAPLDGADGAGSPPSPIPSAPVQLAEATPERPSPPEPPSPSGAAEPQPVDGGTEVAPLADAVLLADASPDARSPEGDAALAEHAAPEHIAPEPAAAKPLSADHIVAEVSSASDAVVEPAASPLWGWTLVDAESTEPTDAAPEPIPILQATASDDDAAPTEFVVAASVSADEPTNLLPEVDWESAEPGIARYDFVPAPAARITSEATPQTDRETPPRAIPEAGKASLEPAASAEAIPFLTPGGADVASPPPAEADPPADAGRASL